MSNMLVWCGGYVFLDDLLHKQWLQGMWSWILKPDLWWNLSGRPLETNCWDDEKTNEDEKQVWTKAWEKDQLWYTWKETWWLEAEIFFLLFKPTIWSPGFVVNTSGSNHIARFPLPGYAHTGLLGDRCRPIAGCCHCRVCFNFSSIVLRHNIDSPTIIVSFNLAAMIFFVIIKSSRVNSSHGLMDLKNRQSKSWDFKSSTERKSTFNVRNWQWDEAKYPKSRSIPDMLTYAMPWSLASCCFGVGDRMCSQGFVESWVKYFWI